MAVTNHAKDQCLPPSWAQRGKLRLACVPGGPAEAARLVLSGEWDHSPAALLAAARYGPALADELATRGVNAVVLTWSPGFSHEGDQAQWDNVKALLPLLRRRRIKAIVRIKVDACFRDELAQHTPEAKDWTLRDGSGVEAPCFPASACCRMDMRNPGWRGYVTHKARMAVEAGCDGLWFDGLKSEDGDTVQFLAELRAQARACRPDDAPELLTCAPGWFGPGWENQVNLKVVTLASVPEFTPEDGLHTNIPLLRLAFEQGGRGKTLAAQAASSGMSEKQRRLAAAEILAAGGACAGLDLPGDYAAFLQSCGNLFGPADPVGATGVLVDDTAAPDPAGGPAILLTGLVAANIQFDVMPLTQLAHFDLRKYKLLITAGFAPPAQLEQALSSFVNLHGGTVYYSALGGSPREELEAHVLPGIRIAAGEAPIEVEAPEGVVALLWGRRTQRWVHVLNYRSEPCAATIALPGCGGRKLSAYSPDETPLALQALEAGQARASFALTALHTYAVVEVV